MVFYQAAVFLLVITSAYSRLSKWHLKRICKETAMIENGEDLHMSFQKRYHSKSYYEIKNFQCKNGYQMNLKNTRDITFRCTEGQWHAYEGILPTWNLKLNNITCERKQRCEPPEIIRNGRFDVRERYCLSVEKVSSCTNTFYDGDKVVYACNLGYQANPYVQKADLATTTTINGFESYEYEYHGQEEDVGKSEPRNLEFECDKSGQWRNDQDDQFPECKRIVCDASRFENITNGNVTNFTSTYDFGQTLELVCDEGYVPTSHYGQLTCLKPTSFEDVKDFGCKRISCPDPVAPIGGRVHFLNRTRFVGDVIRFICDDSKLYGPEERTCLESGEWSGDGCTLCVPEDADCFPPCMNDDNYLITAEPTFRQGSVLQMICTSDENKTVTRTCQVNNKWSNSSLNCREKSDILKSATIAESLNIALSNINTNTSTTNTSDGIVEYTIQVGRRGGVEVYFALDVSGSINNKQFENLKSFTLALVNRLKVSDKEDGTKLAFYIFATETEPLYNAHSTGSCAAFQNTNEAQEYIEEMLNLIRIAEKRSNDIGKGTNIKQILMDIKTDINTKKLMHKKKVPAQQVVILISDGETNTDGNPAEVANELKKLQKDDPVEIYSIYLKTVPSDGESKASGKNLMKSIASSIENEEHYFEIDAENFENVMNQMIEDASGELLPCGKVDPRKSKIKDRADLEVKQKQPSERYAWPWMVQIKIGENVLQHICGGTLIDTQHVLTAAHCFFEENVVRNGPFTLSFESHLTADKRGHEVKVGHDSIHRHENFKKDVEPKFLYDIAIITLPEPVEKYTTTLRPICLPEANEIEKMKIPGTYGVITGWGGNVQELQQAQVMIPDEETCKKSIKKYEKERNEYVFNTTYMFCAGGKDDEAIVDAEHGDSGGPIIIEDPTREDFFFQIGIVSFGFPEERKEKIPYGVYTKLNEDLLDWIDRKTSQEN